MDSQRNKVLIIDDEPVVIQAVNKHLRKDGYEIISANNGMEGLSLFKEENPVLIILDLRMPEMSGLEFLTKINLSPDSSYSVIVLTGHGGDEEMEKCFDFGVTAFLNKPFNAYELRGIVRNAISLKRTQYDLVNQIRAHEKLEIEIRKSKLSFHNIVQKSTDGILVIDQNNLVRFANPVAEILLGRSATELIDRPLGFQVVSGEPREIEIFSNGGKAGVAEMTITESEWEGTTAYLALLRDITSHKQMEKALQESALKLQKAMDGSVEAIALTTEMRDPYTAGHQQRVARLACEIGRVLGFTEDRIKGIHVASTLHDLGKISMPSEILTKPTRLTNIEYSLMKTHSQVGYNILKNVEFPWPIANIVYQHHERIDGSGYPSGLKGDSIMDEAKIICVADVVEAMASHRPYRPALGVDVALEELSINKSFLYDPDVVDACLKLFHEKDFTFE